MAGPTSVRVAMKLYIYWLNVQGNDLEIVCCTFCVPSRFRSSTASRSERATLSSADSDVTVDV